ncbi:MAG: fasciclin domain-containing protein [Bacteroidales bacterium]|nr:fasciclin domain-containing protein [Bacteroidales bacterium]
MKTTASKLFLKGKNFLRISMIALVTLIISGQSNARATNTVVDVIVNSPDHTTLETAVVAAGLVDALSGDGPFTVFAPTDAAFAALPAGTLDALLADPTGQLKEILLYHVVSGKVLSTDLSDGMMATTLLGKDITITINGDGVFINNAKVTVADVMADNGVVHVIDAVLLPPTNTVVDVIVNSADHTTLETAVVAAGLVDALSGDGPFTVFAPTDAAFAALPAGTLDALLADPTGQLKDILLYHVVSGKVLSTDLSDGMMATTLLGKDISITINGDGVFINNAKVTVADVMADNGVVHVIDAVLVPASDPTSVSRNFSGAEEIKIYPNPASEYFIVNMKEQEGMLKIYRMDGSVISSKILRNNENRIEISDLNPGMYFISVDSENTVKSQKLLVK